MIEHATFHARLAVCRQCEFWRGVCTKAHPLQSDVGCPIHRFEGVNGAGFMADLPMPAPSVPTSSGAKCCGATAEVPLKPLTWPDVLRHLTKSIAEWTSAGFAIAAPDAYNARVAVCKKCDQYKWFQCQHCRCIIFTKARLASEKCPLDRWPGS